MDNELRGEVVKAFEQIGFTVIEADTAEEAKSALLGAIAKTDTIGVGGSVSVRETGVLDALRARGQTIYEHWSCPPEQKNDMRRMAMGADAYLCSCNAVTREGHLVFLDGGNRAGAICFGPSKLYVVVSESKLVSGGLAVAINRIKREACPQNARRLGLDTPCSRDGVCRQSECRHRMCPITLALTGVPDGRSVTVVLVREKLGY